MQTVAFVVPPVDQRINIVEDDDPLRGVAMVVVVVQRAAKGLLSALFSPSDPGGPTLVHEREIVQAGGLADDEVHLK